MNSRIIGIDVARALAVIGMIVVNFKVVFGEQGSSILKNITALFEGKAAATFVVLAGVGIALITNNAIERDDSQKLLQIKKGIMKRAVFLFVTGLSYMLLWPADILHFYGIYMILTLFLLRLSGKKLFIAALIIIFSYPLIFLQIDYTLGWDFILLEYKNFWTFDGFFRNLFYNGFHPVFPWTAFMLFGVWFGKMDLHDEDLVKKMFYRSLAVFVSIQLLSCTAILIASKSGPLIKEFLILFTRVEPMPPLPFYMLSGSSFAISIISFCILISKKYEKSLLVNSMHKMGQMALTMYVLHVVMGMGAVEIFAPEKIGKLPVEFSFFYAAIYSFLSVIFAVYWSKRYKRGPLEFLMRKVTG